MLKLSHGRFLGGPFLAHLPQITLFGAKKAVERPRITCFGNSIQFSWLVEGLNRLLPEIQWYPEIAQDRGINILMLKMSVGVQRIEAIKS